MSRYSKIMVPVDLKHPETLEKAVAVAADLSRTFEAPMTLVGVTAPQPGEAARTVDEYKRALADFAARHADALDVKIASQAIVKSDPLRDLDEALEEAVEADGFDLIVMASHTPTFADHLLSSNAGYLASHTPASVFIVR